MSASMLTREYRCLAFIAFPPAALDAPSIALSFVSVGWGRLDGGPSNRSATADRRKIARLAEPLPGWGVRASACGTAVGRQSR
jgi:hypothetical protein